ncbi:MAG: hypothetical protein QM802_13970 [Agriterribacter sp.]
MKNFFIFIFVLFSCNVMAQKEIDTTITVDLLSAPASPASNLLGIAPSDIDKPTDVSSFMLSLQSASNSFTKLPSNYAVDIAPYWLFKKSKKGDITTKGFGESSGINVIKQTLVLSFAIRSPDSLEGSALNAKSIYGGFGFKFSFLRGKYDNSTNEALKKIKALQDIRLRHLDKVMTGYKANVDPDVIELRQKRKDLFKDKTKPEEINAVRASAEFIDIENQLNKKLADYKEKEKTEQEDALDQEIQNIASTFQTYRMGWTWDLAGGISTEFRNMQFNNSKIYNAGVWTTFGYTDTTYGAGLMILRLLHNPDQIFAKDNAVNDIGNITTFDAGVRYIYERPQSKFSASVEAIYRSVLTANTIDPSWRIVFNADYRILPNQKLTFSIGRNFDGTITKAGNLIAALTFLKGFGNKR